MSKISKLSLDELYALPKLTPSVSKRIIELTDFSKLNPQYCEKVCKLKCKDTNSVVLNPLPVDILIIQDHRNPPGKFDRRNGQQDQLQSGVIEFLAKQAGLTGLRYRLVSLTKCAASTQDFGGKPPTQTTLQKCFPYLHQEIISAKPKVIISLGTATTKALGLKRHSNTGNRGEIAFSQYGPVVITLHPKIMTYIRQNARGNAGIWGPDYMRVIQRDFAKAADLVRGKLKYTETTLAETITKLKADRIVVARSIEDVTKIRQTIEGLNPNAVISFDTETTSLDATDPNLKILSLQFGWRDPVTKLIVAAVIPLWHRENRFFTPDEAWEIVKPILLSPRAKAGHNSKYDILVLWWAKGVRVVNVKFDTLLLLHSIESGTQGCYGLKAACWDHLLEEGFAGYEEALGDLKQIKKQKEKEMEKEAAESRDEEDGDSEIAAEVSAENSAGDSAMVLLSKELFE